MNGGMFMHGGCVMTFADFCLFWIARDAIAGQPRSPPPSTASSSAPAGSATWWNAAGEVVKAGRSMVFLRGIITNASAGGAPMMSFSSVLKKIGPRR